ncbi:hypothetical protein NTGHW29_440013 [Candidatus Nitrotoga sp. HW29]|nr:hypothetical protein NTGHW29_440013 [Candidatus Nitrotoga sp. HW29]
MAGRCPRVGDLVQPQHPDNWTAEGVATDAASDNDKFHGVLLFMKKNGDTMTLAGNDIPAGWL